MTMAIEMSWRYVVFCRQFFSSEKFRIIKKDDLNLGFKKFSFFLQVSGHKHVNTLKHYAPDATLEKRLAMAMSINKKKPPLQNVQRRIQPPQVTENVPLVQEQIDLGSGINIPRFEEFVCSVCFDVFYGHNLLLRHITSNHKELLNMARKRQVQIFVFIFTLGMI